VEARRELRAAAGDRWGDVPYLLGGWGTRKDVRTGQLLDGLKEKWKPDLAVVKATIRFLEKTGRLSIQQEALLTNGRDRTFSEMILRSTIGVYVRSLIRDGSYGHRE
jgi:hypothetical protein